MSFKYRFTVFTPTFNRAHTLPRVYESLARQTFRDFEWLVVDDGSTDGTEQLMSDWARAGSFAIEYVKQANGGKHAAFNTGTCAARGELFLNLDSDDACVPQALERFDWHWRQLAGLERFSGVSALCADQFGHIVGDRFPADILDSDNLEVVYRYRVRGEKWGFQRTDIMRRFPFPAAPARTYVGESLIWARIARQYKTRYVNEALRTYFHDPSGRIMTRPFRQQALSVPIRLDYLRENADWLARRPTDLLKAATAFSRLAFHAGDGARTIARVVARENGPVRWAVLAASLPALALYVDDRIRGR